MLYKKPLFKKLLLLFLNCLFLQAAFLHAAFSQENIPFKWWAASQNAFPAIEGQAWPEELTGTYNRLPARAEDMVRKAVWNLSRESAGLLVRLRSNAGEIRVRYTVEDPLDMPHMPATGVSGVDLYALSEDGAWEWSAGKYSFGDTIEYHFKSLSNDYTREYRLYLPLYNKVKWLEIGVPENALMEALPVRTEKPVVIYGTSIAQGGCASRPGLAWTAQLGRKMDMPVINLAFSGNGRLEEPLASLLAETDAKIYIIDCLPNMSRFPDDTIRTRLIKTVKTLREKRPEVPVLVVENADASIGSLDTSRVKGFDRLNKIARSAFAEMKAAGMRKIHYLAAEKIGLTIESTVDGVHPNDIGMEQYASAYEIAIREILHQPQGEYATIRPVIQYRDKAYDWDARHRALLEMNKTNPPAIAFLGNSITHYWGGEPKAPIARGEDSWEKYLSPRGVRNFGYGWDRVENVLWRVYHGELDGFNARQVVIAIGTNNIGLNTDKEIIAGLQLLIRAIKARQPSAEILLLGIYPRRDMEQKVAALNEQIAQITASENIQYGNPGTVLLDKTGKITESLFTDGLHPNAAGYQLLGEAISPYLVKASE